MNLLCVNSHIRSHAAELRLVIAMARFASMGKVHQVMVVAPSHKPCPTKVLPTYEAQTNLS